MDFELIPVQFNKILQSQNYTVFILEAGEKRFAIYTSPHIGQNLQVHLADQAKPRPYTYDLMNSIFKGLDINLLQVVITDVQDTLYFARLYVEQETDGLRNILEIDARPSDCLTLALENDIPIFCTKEVFDKTISIEE
jgi:bifunctional DNase/RNase